MLPAADMTRAVPTRGATAMRTPWRSSRVIPDVAGGAGVEQVGGQWRINSGQGGDPGEHQLSRFEVTMLNRRGGDGGECVEDR